MKLNALREYALASAIMSTCMVLPSLRQRLQMGHKSYGPLVLSDSSLVTEMLATLGYGHIVIDHEHAATDILSGQSLLQGIQAAHSFTMDPDFSPPHKGPFRTEPIVRLPSANDPVYMKKVLDTLRLPGGVLVPMVNDAATAEAVVQSTRYPSQVDQQSEDPVKEGGIRGCAAPLVRASGWGFHQNYVQSTVKDLLVMVQVETPEAVGAIPDIAAVPGVDGIFLGPYDLSCSLGKMGKFDDPEVKDLIKRAEEAVVSSKECFLAGFRSPGRDLHEMFHVAGYSLVCGTVDMAMLRQCAQEDLNSADAILSNG